MIWLTTGPVLRDRIKRILAEQLETRDCRVIYSYVDAHAKRQPEYAATHIVIRAFNVVMNQQWVDRIAETLETLPHLVSVERIVRHATLRPQAVALFERVSS